MAASAAALSSADSNTLLAARCTGLADRELGDPERRDLELADTASRGLEGRGLAGLETGRGEAGFNCVRK